MGHHIFKFSWRWQLGPNINLYKLAHSFSLPYFHLNHATQINYITMLPLTFNT